MCSFTPFKCSIKDFKRFIKDLDLSELDITQKLFSEGIKRLIGKMKFESSPKIELDEAVISTSKSYIIGKPSKSTETAKEQNPNIKTQ